MTSGLIAQLVIYMVVLLLAISAHEAAHAWMSYKFGDDTARLLGRITLNPVAHIDPIGTLLIPIASFIFAHMGGLPVALIGWGKPTPVNPLRWRQKDLANVMVSIAGILANLTLASIALILLHLAYYLHLLGEGAVLASVEEPVVLFLFTALPPPPLWGRSVLWTIPRSRTEPAPEVLARFRSSSLLRLKQKGFCAKS